MMPLTRRLLLGALAGLAGLAGLALSFPALAQQPRPTLTVGQTFIAGGLDPAEGSAGWALVSHGVAEQLFAVSREGTVVPRLASGAVRTGDTTWDVQLTEGRFFSDGSPVDAEAVAAALNRSGELNPTARASAGPLTFTVTAPLTLTVETERPTPILPSILAEWAMPVYRMTDTGPVFTGPYAIAAFDPGARLSLTPNPHYARAAERPDVTVIRVADAQALALGLQAGELDLAFNLPVEMLPMLERSDALTIKSFPVEYQYMLWMNTRSPALSDPRVRQAIDRAISRADLAQAARAGIPATGAYAPRFPFAADLAAPHDLEAAALLLDRAGWLPGNDGLRRKAGETLTLRLLAYPQRPDLVTFQPVVRAALEDLGITVSTAVTESPSEAARGSDWDLFLWAQHTAPAGDPGFFLSLFLSTDGANNYSGWSDPDFDAVLARLGAEADPARRADVAREAQAIIAAGVPVSFLLTPEWHVGLSKRLAGYEPWGSDYYVIRDDFGLGLVQ